MYASAMVAAAVYNVNRKKGTKPIDPKKLVPQIMTAMDQKGSFFQDLKSMIIQAKGAKNDRSKRITRKARD